LHLLAAVHLLVAVPLAELVQALDVQVPLGLVDLLVPVLLGSFLVREVVVVVDVLVQSAATVSVGR